LAALCCAWSTDATAQAPFIRIAKTGDAVPGVSGATWDSVGMPAIDAGGSVVLRAEMEGPGINTTNDQVILHGRPGNLRIVVRDGDLFPQFGEGVYQRAFSQPLISQTGQIGYEAKLDGPGITSSNDDIFWAGPPGALQVVVRQGQPAPGITDGGTLGTFSEAMGRNGHVALSGGISGPGSLQRQGLWSGTPDDPRLVTYSGAPAPGTEPGVTFPSSGVLAPTWTVNARGAIAFPASLEGPGIDATNNAGIWAGTADDLALVMRAGDPAPLPESGSTFIGRPEYAIINGNDRVMFPGFVTGPGIDTSNDYALWTGDASGAFQLIARESDEVPLLGADFTITNIFPFIQTEDDRIAVVESFTGPGVTPDHNQAIFWGGPDAWVLLFREGDQAPGLPPGVLLDLDVETPTIAILESGASGMVLGLTGSGVTESNNEALFWRRSDFDPWLLVAREGEQFDGSIVGDGGLFIRANGGGAGVRPSLNDGGSLAFWVRFEGEFPNDVTGAYLVPSPGPAVLLGAGALQILWRRRRSNG
jgi:hypothetical protein